MWNWKALRDDKKGMTLIELMVSFSIFTILLGIALSVMLFGSKIFGNQTDKDRMKMLGDEMYQFVSDKLTFATHVQLEKENTDPSKMKYENVIFVSGGRLFYGPKEGPYKEYTSSDLYQKTLLVLNADVVSSSVLAMEFSFHQEGESGEAVYQTGSALKFVNLAAKTDAVPIEGTGAYRNPVISYDTVPYKVEEGFVEKPESTDNPYTVYHYPENNPVRKLQNNHTYARGEIARDKQGVYWQAIEEVKYRHDTPDSWPGAKLENKWKLLSEEWENEDMITAYDYHDVVLYEGEYFMSTMKTPNYWSPRDQYGTIWIRAYWWPEYSTPENRMLGWSTDQGQYTSIFETYP